MKIWLLIIFILAAILRLYSLNLVPPSPSLDEVSIGYNAYSILHTGRDEYGSPLPLLLRAYDDWRPALYVYLVVPFIALFGLDVLSVRLPSVILSLLSVFATYFLTLEVLGIGKLHVLRKELNKERIALLSCFLLAISPWHIYISRLGHEVNLGLFTIIAGIYFFLRFTREKKTPLFVFSVIFFVLSLYSYQSQKLIVPTIVILGSIIFWKQLILLKRSLFIGIAIGLVVLIPFLIISISPNALIRLRGTNAFSASSDRYAKSAVKILEAKQRGDLIGEIINNRRVVSLTIFSENYLSHFNPNWLTKNEGNEQHKVPNLGLLYPFEFVFMITGLILLLRSDITLQNKTFLLVVILSAPLAAGITTGAPHAMRAYTFLPFLQILAGVGGVYLYSFVRKGLVRYILNSFALLVVTFGIFVFIKNYFYVFPREQSGSFQYALRSAILYIDSDSQKDKTLFISNKDALYQSYMFYLFYTKFDPVEYQKLGGSVSGGFNETHKIGNVFFTPLPQVLEKNGLYVGNIYEMPKDLSDVTIFNDLNGKRRIGVVEVSK